MCVVIIEAHLLPWECTDVSLWLQCGLMLKGVYCFITHKRCCGMGGCDSAAKTWTEFRPVCGSLGGNSEQWAVLSFFFSSSLFYLHLKTNILLHIRVGVQLQMCYLTLNARDSGAMPGLGCQSPAFSTPTILPVRLPTTPCTLTLHFLLNTGSSYASCSTCSVKQFSSI